MGHRDLISLVFAFRNEESNLEELISRVGRVFNDLPEDYELIFVNDDSTDRSLEILTEQSKKNPRITTITLSRNFGVFESIMAGFEEADGDAVIYLDADLQDPPEVIPQLIEEWKKGSDVVHTVRTSRLGEPKFKLMMTSLAYKLISLTAKIKLPLDAGDFKLLSRRAVDQILRCRESDPYIRGLTVWIGYKQSYIYYQRAARHSGQSHFSFFSFYPWKTFFTGLTSFSFAPLVVILVGAALGFVLFLFWLLMAGISFLKGGSVSPLFLVVGLGILAWSTVMSALGVMGLYILRIQ